MKQNMEHTRLLVLSLLPGQDMYGYQMIAELERSRQDLSHEGGTLYPFSQPGNEGALRAYSREDEGPGAEYTVSQKKRAALLQRKKPAGGAMSRASTCGGAGMMEALSASRWRMPPRPKGPGDEWRHKAELTPTGGPLRRLGSGA
jgi:PadR family transcriptional regulator PadR